MVRFEQFYRSDMLQEVFRSKNILPNLSIWNCFVHQQDSLNEGNDETSIEVESILTSMIESKSRVVWIYGEHGIGKSAMSALFVLHWNIKNRLPCVEKFQHVVLISCAFAPNTDFNIIEYIFPLTRHVVNGDILREYLSNNCILLLLDDVDTLSNSELELVLKQLEEYTNLHLILVSTSSYWSYSMNIRRDLNPLCIHHSGLKDNSILSLSEKLTSNDDSKASCKDFIKLNLNRLSPILKYPSILIDFCSLWREEPAHLKGFFTASEIMWNILITKAKNVLEVNFDYPGVSKKQLFQWLSNSGAAFLELIGKTSKISDSLLSNLEANLLKHFPVSTSKFCEVLFQPNFLYLGTTHINRRSSSCKPFIEYLISLFIMEKLMKKDNLDPLIAMAPDQQSVVLFIAGQLTRLQDDGAVSIAEEKRIIKTLVKYSDTSFDDIQFLQLLVTELKCIKRLVAIVIDNSEYNEEWELNVGNIQQKSLETLLNHVSPIRLIFLVDSPRLNYELQPILEFVIRVKISVWLDSSPQFTYGNTQTMDKLVKPFLADEVIPKLDMISGCLSSAFMKELPKAKSLQHLILLRLKVSTDKALNRALTLPKYLLQLLWLEVKIDMNLDDISIPTITKTNVPLFDIYMRDIDHNHVSIIPDFLRRMHSRYTGIHLDNTSLTPEGVFTILKELHRRQISLCAEKDSINKFRRWYYPNLSSVPKWKPLTEEKMVTLIGHDDRSFYSAHQVNSSRFVTALDAWNLKSYLESQERIVHFTYEANNIVFAKGLDGRVSTSFKSNYKENLIQSTNIMRKESVAGADFFVKPPEISDLY